MFTPDYLMPSVYAVDVDFIKSIGKKAVIFDIDNTLVGFKVKQPDDKIKNYIDSLLSQGIKVAIASNNNAQRVGTFCESLDVPFIHRAAKPLPFGLCGLCKKLGVRPKQTVLVGDQVYTDSLGANLLGMTSVMVDIIDTKETLLFKIKRALEKPVINRKRRKDLKNK